MLATSICEDSFPSKKPGGLGHVRRIQLAVLELPRELRVEPAVHDDDVGDAVLRQQLEVRCRLHGADEDTSAAGGAGGIVRCFRAFSEVFQVL